jgi:histidinol-phosphate aminotransferase
MTPNIALHVEPRIRLDRNERLVPSPSLVDLSRRLPAETLNTYPDATPFEAALAQLWDVDPARVLAAAGGDDAIDRVCRAWVGPGLELVTVSPTFEMFPFFTALAGGSVRYIPTLEHPAPLDTLAVRVGPDTGVVLAISPHNPTGAVATEEELVALAMSLPANVRLLVDLAYVEFADADPTSALLDLENVVVLRTLSKAWGLAGARVGYAMGSVDAIVELREAGPPFPLAGPSLWLAERALALEPAVTGPYVAAVRRERPTLTKLLQAIGAEPMPSQANFVLARFTDADLAASRLGAADIRVRRFPDSPEMLRITLPGDERVFQRLVTTLEDIPTEKT